MASSKRSRPSEYLKLFRLQTGATTALAPIIGYLVIAAQTGYQIVLTELALLFIIGILMHIFVFVLNEYIDLDVDRLAPDLAKKPLVSGTITPNAALAAAFIALIISYIIYFIYFFNLWALIFLTLSYEFGAIYDIKGKRFAGSDFTLALWIFFFCLFGASIVTTEFTGVLYLVAGLGFFQILFNNAVEGGLKDADHDALAGAHTLANKLGVRVIKNNLKITRTFKFSSYAIKLAHISLVVLLLFTGIFKITNLLNYLHLILIIFLIFVIFFTLHKFMNMSEFNRDKLKRIFSIHEIATFYLATIILLQLIGFVAVIFLLLFPLLWYMALNLILYGKLLVPRV
jgi:4-hydroxybenzoate polyprenyltransferase